MTEHAFLTTITIIFAALMLVDHLLIHRKPHRR